MLLSMIVFISLSLTSSASALCSFHLIEDNDPVTVHDRVQSVSNRQHGAVQKLCPYGRLAQYVNISGVLYMYLVNISGVLSICISAQYPQFITLPARGHLFPGPLQRWPRPALAPLFSSAGPWQEKISTSYHKNCIIVVARKKA